MKLSSNDIFKKALSSLGNTKDILKIHEKTYEILKEEKEKYYKIELDKFLSSVDISEEEKRKVENALLQKRNVDNKEYSNFM